MNSYSADPNSSHSGSAKVSEISISFDKTNSHKIPFPPVGFCRLCRQDQLSKSEINSLAKLNFSFYTILLHLYSGNWQDEFRMANSEAKGLKVPMQVILQFGPDISHELSEFIQLCNIIFPFVEEVILTHKDSKITPAGLLQKTLPGLREGLHHVKIGVGSFNELNEIVKHKPDLSEADFLAVPFHSYLSSDSGTLNQTNPAKEIELIHSLKAHCGSKHLYVIPMSLNSGLTMMSGDHPFILTNDSETVQYLNAIGKSMSNFKSLAFSGVDSISIYDNAGKSEILSKDIETNKLDRINSVPFFHLLQDVLEMNSGFIIQPENAAPSLVDAFIFSAGGKIKVLLINLSGDDQVVSLKGVSQHPKIKLYNSLSIKEILEHVEEFEIKEGEEITIQHACAKIGIQPHAIALIMD